MKITLFNMVQPQREDMIAMLEATVMMITGTFLNLTTRNEENMLSKS